jgi:hypothetical protein
MRASLAAELSRTGPPARVACALVTGMLAVAAGFSNHTHPTSHRASATAAVGHTAFVAEAEQVCARPVSAHAGQPFPVAGFDPEQPRPSQLPTVGD